MSYTCAANVHSLRVKGWWQELELVDVQVTERCAQGAMLPSADWGELARDARALPHLFAPGRLGGDGHNLVSYNVGVLEGRLFVLVGGGSCEGEGAHVGALPGQAQIQGQDGDWGTVLVCSKMYSLGI